MRTDTELRRPDGAVLRGWIRLPASPAEDRAARGNAGPAKAVWLVHGLGEHLGRHDELAEWFLARGFVVAGHDHRGHGRSSGRRATISAAEDLVDDLEAGLAALADRLGGRAGEPSARLAGPPLLFGQSLGGLVALSLALRAPERVAGLVMSSPALDPGLSRAQALLYRTMLALAPDLPVPSGLKPERLSHDPEVARRWHADPLVHGRITARLLRFVVEGSARALREAPRLAVPALLQFGTDDDFVDPEGSRRFAAAAPVHRLTAREYPGLRHELQQEPEPMRERVRADLADWLARVA